MPFGAALTPDGARFAIWAPSAESAEVEVDGRRVPMQRGAQGFFHCFDTQAGPGSRYAFRFAGVDLKVPDPASRSKALVSAPAHFEQGTWYTLVLETKGGDVVARVAGQEPLRATSPDFRVKKPGIEFRVSGRDNGKVLFDNLRVWELN